MSPITTPHEGRVPDFGYRAPARKDVRVLWKLSLVLSAVVLTFYMWQCGSAIMMGRNSANQLVRHFHRELNSAQYGEIFDEADEGFTKREELASLLGAVHTKLGDAGTESLTNMSVNAGTDGTFVTTEYKTVFARGSAIETFTWIKKGGTLKLYGYNVQSSVFVTD